MQSNCAVAAGGAFFQYEFHIINFNTYVGFKKNRRPQAKKPNFKYVIKGPPLKKNKKTVYTTYNNIYHASTQEKTRNRE